ncbi:MULTISPECIES: iron-containing alcohol dehydrogenase [Pseudoalteromonas]|uniref:Alcohol dehydrogenase with dehydroquinate synthase-like domain n=3 Tax=Pseudoalteromonas TaxID=53246 RepID=Q3ILH2_PSET1|nr:MULTISPECIES: iron-containing alcohol dehydrogenase [Pseudoalteromonas]ALS31987.1 NADP-dependent alcohol dehydrogenase [Pseudoalteromonas translucida KMM 520]ASM52976.1 NADP-dependent alcohol dehydrogenase [Pseudoalteromonas nigrifaciens]MBH0071806.1 iron-containing alcohol dehydrogenase [Pseudoalteromonas sp. NZS127]MBH0092463.1 iron-containing alcohol dehydrogenase [Pseudoalteromonas sp. SCQQ13]CAI85661.1 putative alcohol dehydrogenase with dehydroquinate synthase-like domain [Pseudoalter|tara:strand:+ start:3369 stop:4514 length:1146 start_codon:yes stop_codon:yes gene_type:complete
MKFSYVNPTLIQFGQQQIASLTDLIAKDQKVLVVYGGGSIKKNGVYDQVAAALEGFDWVEFSGVGANPTIEVLDQAVKICKEQDIDFVLGVGGGSVIDGVKYIAASAVYDGEGWDIPTGKHKVTSALPIGAVLTLPATGSESNQGSVVSKAATKQKLPFMSPAVQPKFAIMDPDVMKTLPQRQLVNGLVDAWVHTCEQYLTFPEGALVQDGYAEALLKALKVLGDNFENQDDAWRANLMWSANQALNGLIGSGVSQDWATHMIGHELTAAYGVDHARSLAIVQPSLLRNQFAVKKAKLEQMGKNVFGLAQSDDLAELTIQAIEAFYHSLDVATQLTEHGEDKAAAIDNIIGKLEAHGMLALGENQAITLKESREILEQAVA